MKPTTLSCLITSFLLLLATPAQSETYPKAMFVGTGYLENPALVSFLKKHSFPVQPTKEIIGAYSLPQSGDKYGSENNACKKSDVFFFVEGSQLDSNHWFGVIKKTIVAADMNRDITPSSMGEVHQNYANMRKKFGKPTEELFSTQIGNVGAPPTSLEYSINYDGAPVVVSLRAGNLLGCFSVNVTYYKLNKPTTKGRSAIADSL